jgi:hypothetical protein
MSQRGSRFMGMVLALSITAAALFCIFVMVDAMRNDPGPAIIGGMLGTAVFGAVLLGPIGRTIGKMLSSDATAPDDTARRLDAIEYQLGEPPADGARFGELEERIEFLDRMLAQRQHAKLSQHHTPV